MRCKCRRCEPIYRDGSPRSLAILAFAGLGTSPSPFDGLRMRFRRVQGEGRGAALRVRGVARGAAVGLAGRGAQTPYLYGRTHSNFPGETRSNRSELLPGLPTACLWGNALYVPSAKPGQAERKSSIEKGSINLRALTALTIAS